MRTYRSMKQLTLYQFRAMFRNKIALFFSMVLPLAFLVVFGAMFGKNGNTAAFDILLPGQLAFMLLSAGLVTVAISIAMQRSSGAMRHLFSTPLPMGVWIASRILANLVMMLVQVVVLYLVAYLAFGVHLPANLPGTAVLLLLSTLMTLGFGLAIGIMTRNPDTALALAMILSMSMAFLGGSMMPLNEAPEILQWIAKLAPSYYMTNSLRLVMMQGEGLGSVLPDIAVLTGCVVVTFGLAARKMRQLFLAAAS